LFGWVSQWVGFKFGNYGMLDVPGQHIQLCMELKMDMLFLFGKEVEKSKGLWSWIERGGI
jgi:hypothetical protein